MQHFDSFVLFVGFSDALKIRFPIYTKDVLNYVSDYLCRKRIKHVNFLLQEKNRLRNEANAAKRAKKKEEKEEEERKAMFDGQTLRGKIKQLQHIGQPSQSTFQFNFVFIFCYLNEFFVSISIEIK